MKTDPPKIDVSLPPLRAASGRALAQ